MKIKTIFLFICLTLSICSYANAKEIIRCKTSTNDYAGPTTMMQCEGTKNDTLENLYKKGYRLIQVLDLGLQVDESAVYYLEK